ncbi:NAD(P)-binding domain-containing protein [Rozella allomycis CSF55]|uniref:NAD(P)-binding domain-containing protein n=1 Tax=Rozella allomycis (strain CSF55) TaxID=988480 RepID=A0A075AS71_ROZAC|nr:NAD(P)-binding domain-containing protein [Rozella allomycis CSF55]|eukprot:EPZ33035.1 NAD(P)-binding domain-containing protein [Rozella allomycis CSF55]
MNLSEDETKLYDRQLRLFGIESQQKIRNARVVIVGKLNSTMQEVLKNLVLVGVGSFLFYKVTEIEDEHLTLFGASLESTLEHMRTLNHSVKVEKVLHMDDIDYKIMLAFGLEKNEVINLNNLCRQRDAQFVACDVKGTYAAILIDGLNHQFVTEYKRKSESNKDVEVDVIETRKEIYEHVKKIFNLKPLGAEILKKLKRSTNLFSPLVPLFIGNEILSTRSAYWNDSDNLVLSTSSECLKIGLPGDFVPKELAEHFQSSEGLDIPFVGALVGGLLSQEVIKLISERDPPANYGIFINSMEPSAFILQ